MRDGIGQVRPVQRIEVELVHPVRLQQPHLLGCDDRGDHAPGLGVVVGAFEHRAQPFRHRCAAHGAELRRLGIVRHRHNAGHDRRGDPRRQRAIEKA